MKRKTVIQICVCLVLFTAMLTAERSELKTVRSGAEKVIAFISINYNGEDLKGITMNCFRKIGAVAGGIDEAVDVITGKPVYGEPIDDKYNGKEAPVYAVAGGKITAVGENETIGKYVRITHGDQAESLYGNLNEVFVKKSQNVKKGFVIATYRKSKEKEFYYSLNDFK